MVTAPIANVSMEYIKNYDKIHSQLEKISEDAMSEDYIDYNIVNSEEHLLENENFRDDAHLNDSGVEIVDKHFSKWLKGTIKGIAVLLLQQNGFKKLILKVHLSLKELPLLPDKQGSHNILHHEL